MELKGLVIKADVRGFKQAMSDIRWQLLYTGFIIKLYNIFNKTKVKMDVKVQEIKDKVVPVSISISLLNK